MFLSRIQHFFRTCFINNLQAVFKIIIFDKNVHLGHQKILINPFGHGRFFGPIFQSALRGGKTKFFDFFFIGASAIKSFVRSTIFRYELPNGILSKGQNFGEGGAQSAPPPWVKGLMCELNFREIKYFLCRWGYH